MCCRYEDVDINSGRVQYTRYLLYCKISEKVEDSLLTKTLGPFEENIQPNWQRVNTFSPGVGHSPHYIYHGAFSQIHLVEKLWEMFTFSEEAKRHMAQTVLDKWQADGNDWGVKMYLQDVGNVCFQKIELDPNAIISVADLSSIADESDTN